MKTLGNIFTNITKKKKIVDIAHWIIQWIYPFSAIVRVIPVPSLCYCKRMVIGM